MYLLIYACMHKSMYICVNMCMYTHVISGCHPLCTSVNVFMHACIYACVHTCTCVCVHVYVCMRLLSLHAKNLYARNDLYVYTYVFGVRTKSS